ncbi:MAG: glucosaminidase domain-containing protein [Reyranellaceae bacterium]
MAFAEPVPSPDDIESYFYFGSTRLADAGPDQADLPPLNAEPESLVFIQQPVSEPDDTFNRQIADAFRGHGRFAAPGNALRRQGQGRPFNPRTADELAGFFRAASYTLTDVRQGEAVPPIKIERVPEDLGSKAGTERKALFITAVLPAVLEVNQRVLADRKQLVHLRDKLAWSTAGLSSIERLWLEDLAARYDTSPDSIDELLRRVDIVPPSMAIAQGGVESGWGTSLAARAGNSLFGQIQSTGRHTVSVPWQPGRGMPQPFASIGESTEAYVANLNTHPAYAAFRAERAALRARGDQLDGYHLIGTLLRYSELGQNYVKFVREIMRENDMADFDRARLSSF